MENPIKLDINQPSYYLMMCDNCGIFHILYVNVQNPQPFKMTRKGCIAGCPLEKTCDAFAAVIAKELTFGPGVVE